MSSFSLYDRFTKQGTISEPKGIPDPRYALPSTVHWMRSYKLLIGNTGLDYQSAAAFYKPVSKVPMCAPQENSIFEHLLLGLHQLSALRAMEEIDVQADIARVASVAWYYGIYAAATAMVAAQDGSLQDNHTQTANTWDRQFVQCNLILAPFDLRISTLVKKDADNEIDAFRCGAKTNLVNPPLSVDDAQDYICGYLSGTRNWWGWRVEEEIRNSKEFKALGVTNFRTKAARDLRDRRLARQSISFLHQAIRFRGKANYREALYLAHGSSVESIISDYVTDLADVLEAFLLMAGAFSFKRLGQTLKADFLNDLHRHRSFTTDPSKLWA